MNSKMLLAKVGILLFILSCQSGNDSIQITKPNVAATPPPKVELSADMQAEVKATPLPNRYVVELNWTSNLDPKSWVIHRQRRIGENGELKTLEGKNRKFIDTNVVAGESYTYRLATDEISTLSLKKNANVIIPRDIVIVGTEKVSHIAGTNRLFFEDDSKIVTDGQNLTIAVNEMIVGDNVQIETFQKNAVAVGESANGKSGGKIVIRTKTGNGYLAIYGIGQNGSAGKEGTPGACGVPGAAGAAGRCSEHTRRVRAFLDIFFPKAYASEPREVPAKFIEQQYKLCDVHPEDGKPGNPGLNGGNGTGGGNGGDSAKVFIEVEDPKADLEIEVLTEFGIGGKGGNAGLPGAGAPGGSGGDRPCGECRVAVQGSTGTWGASGAAGPAGKNGQAFAACQKLGFVLSGRGCEQFADILAPLQRE